MVSIHRSPGYGPGAFPLRHGAPLKLEFKVKNKTHFSHRRPSVVIGRIKETLTVDIPLQFYQD
jgi:hypothetical protein